MFKKMKSISLLAISALVLVSCGGEPQKYEGYTDMGNNLYVKYYSQNAEGRKVAAGDRVQLNLEYKTVGDSVLWTSAGIGRPFLLNSEDKFYKGYIMEAILGMAEGDSASLITSADSFYTYVLQQPLPQGLAVGSDLKFDLKVVQTRTTEELQAEFMKKEEEQAVKEDEIIKKYLADNGITAEPSISGLYYIEEVKGKGSKAEAGKMVSVHYEGTLLDGTKFDSSYDRGEPIEFPLGTGSVIKGWDEGISNMTVGTKATLIIPSFLAYGSQQRGPVIAPYSILKFKVELVDVK